MVPPPQLREVPWDHLGGLPESFGPRMPDSVRVRRAVTLVVLSALLPGSAEVAAGHRRVGLLMVKTWAGLFGAGVLFGLVWLLARPVALRLAATHWVLTVVGSASLAWAPLAGGLLIRSWWLGRPGTLPRRARRLLVALTVILLVLCTYPPVAVGRRLLAAADLIDAVFSARRVSGAVDGRYTVLLLGGDAGPHRIGTRPDSVTVASIDARTGRTVLFSLPRNLENVPFARGSAAARAKPNGFSCGDPCLLNAIYTWGGEHPDLFPGVADPGAEAMKEAAEGVTGLVVNYYVLIDLQGFRQLIDALGGIQVTVRERVPIGGGSSAVSGYIEPGTRRLDGYHALWFARSRHGSNDYQRMARQRCVMDAMLHQLDPATVLTRFQAIAAASEHVVSTDLPAGQLPAFVELAARAKQHAVTSVQFVPPLIRPAYPDYRLIRNTVREAIAQARVSADAPRVSGKATGPASPGTGTASSGGTASPGGGASGGGAGSGGPGSGGGASGGAGSGGAGSGGAGSDGASGGRSASAATSPAGASDPSAGAAVDIAAICSAA